MAWMVQNIQVDQGTDKALDPLVTILRLPLMVRLDRKHIDIEYIMNIETHSFL